MTKYSPDFHCVCSSVLQACWVPPRVQIHSEISHFPSFPSLLVSSSSGSRQRWAVCSRLPDWKLWVRDSSSPLFPLPVSVIAWPLGAFTALPSALPGVFVQPCSVEALRGHTRSGSPSCPPLLAKTSKIHFYQLVICGLNCVDICSWSHDNMKQEGFVSPSQRMNEWTGRKTRTSPPRCLQAGNIDG